MSMLALIRRKNQPQALIKAPDAGLIKSDEAPEIPEQVDISCDLTTEQMSEYMAAVKNTDFWNGRLEVEYLRHLLKGLGCKQYLQQDIDKFTDKYKNFLRARVGKKTFLYWRSMNYETYGEFLPPRIINKIAEIRNNFPNVHKLSFSLRGPDGFHENFAQSNINKSDLPNILFLEVAVKDIRGSLLIIDAWRGPTFSDRDDCRPIVKR